MNRRNFFARTAGLFVAGIAARYLPEAPTPWKSKLWTNTDQFVGPLTYRGIPLTFDKHAPSNAVYFLSPDGPYRLNGSTTERLSS